jgi:hypothetical protein
MKENIRDMVINETGKENPRKKISIFIFGGSSIRKKVFIVIITPDKTRAIDRHKSVAW